MTRSDYVAISAVLRAQRPDPKTGTVSEKRIWESVVHGLADLMEKDNEKFERARFIDSCEGRSRA